MICLKYTHLHLGPCTCAYILGKSRYNYELHVIFAAYIKVKNIKLMTIKLILNDNSMQ